MNKGWIRSPRIEDSYEELYKIRPQIYYWIPQERGINKVKIVHSGKEIILTEFLERGWTKEVTVEIDGVKVSHNLVREAEAEINKLLR